MLQHTRPCGPPWRPALRLGDLVSLTYRTGSGPASWTGSIVAVDEARGTATITDGARRHEAALKGAAYVHVLVPAAERVDLVDGIPTSLDHAAPAPAPAYA